VLKRTAGQQEARASTVFLYLPSSTQCTIVTFNPFTSRPRAGGCRHHTHVRQQSGCAVHTIQDPWPHPHHGPRGCHWCEGGGIEAEVAMGCLANRQSVRRGGLRKPKKALAAGRDVLMHCWWHCSQCRTALLAHPPASAHCLRTPTPTT